MACHGARRLLAMARNTGHVIGIELLAAAQGCDFHAPLRSSEQLERVRALLRERVPRLDDDRYLAPDIAVATELVTTGRVAREGARRSPPGLRHGPEPVMTIHSRIDNARLIRAPRGAEITAKSWLTEAPLRMLMNNLDPEVAEKPQRARRLRRHRPRRARLGQLRSHRRVAQEAGRRRDAARAIRQAGRHLPHPCRRAARAHRQFEPRARLGDLGAFPRARSARPHDVRPDDRGLVDLYRLAGHRAGHLRDLRRGRAGGITAATSRVDGS